MHIRESTLHWSTANLQQEEDDNNDDNYKDQKSHQHAHYGSHYTTTATTVFTRYWFWYGYACNSKYFSYNRTIMDHYQTSFINADISVGFSPWQSFCLLKNYQYLGFIFFLYPSCTFILLCWLLVTLGSHFKCNKYSSCNNLIWIVMLHIILWC